MTSVQAFRDFINQRLNAAAGEIFTEFEQTIVRYEEEIDRQRRLLEICWKPRIKLHRTELRQHHDCREETSYFQEQEELEPLQIKEEPEEPEPPQIKEEPEEPGLLLFNLNQLEPEPPQFEDLEELGPSQEAEQLKLKFESETLRVPSIGEPSYLIEPEEAPDSEQFLSHDHVDNFPEPENQAKCQVILSGEPCGKIVHNKQNLCQTFENFTATLNRPCEICGKTFTRPYDLLRHMRTHNLYSCETCQKSFTRQSQLLVHIRCHTGEKPYSCEFCEKRFAQQSQLLVHIRCHTGEKPYSCEICGRSFTRPSHLTVHIRSHTGEKPYSCRTCRKCFSDRSDLLRHTRSHTGEKPYSCKMCGKSFTRHSNLLVHVRSHTGEKPFSCGTCQKSFSDRSYLLRHMRVHKCEKTNSCETTNEQI